MVVCSSIFRSPVPIKLHSARGAGSNNQFSASKFPISQDFNSEAQIGKGWSFVGGSKLKLEPRSKRLLVPCKTDAAVYASLWTSSQIARSVFTLGTAAVLPFYTLMVVAPKAEITKKSMRSCLPYIVFGTVYAYLLYLSWTPGTLQAMFASKYWMPELSAIAALFTNEMSLSSAWIHLLAIDLFAARQVYHEGLANDIETRHSGYKKKQSEAISVIVPLQPAGMVMRYTFFHAQFSTLIHPRFRISNLLSPSPNADFDPKWRPANKKAEWNSASGTRISIGPKFGKFMHEKAGSGTNVCATMCATTIFNLGTAVVLPLYTLMVIAPKQKMTKKIMESHVPYVALSLLYAYVLLLSWTPQHMGALFGGTSMMPDFSRIGVLFFSELSTAAAWIHLLLIDLFAARQVFLDGLDNEVETRHSIIMCLFFGPVGVLSHFVTKTLTRMSRS